MPDFRIAETAPEHPKLRAAGPAAVGLWAMAGAYAMGTAQLTDGWVPYYWVATWQGGPRLAKTLVRVGLWTEEQRNGVPGYQFHDWLDIQRSREGIEDEKRKARDRMAAVRKRPSTGPSTRDVRANTTRTFAEGSDERSPNVHDSQSLSLSQWSSREEGSPPARASEPPPPRCPKHINEPAPGPCGACADARRRGEAWQAAQDQARAALADELAAARADPRQRCDHGTDGGRHRRSDTGESLCALCRAEQAARTPA